MKKNLRKIANTLILYSYHIENNGFLNGKMGIAFFLYHYARYTKDMEYNDFADDIIDNILADANCVPFDFENGLTGIGWAIDYLMRNRFLDGDPKEALQYVDDKVFLHTSVNNIRNMLPGQGLYLLSRIMNSEIERKYINKTEKIVDSYCVQLKENTQTISLCYLNSLLYFFVHIDKLNICKNQIKEAKKLILDQVSTSFKDDAVSVSDKYAFYDMLKLIDAKQENEWKQILELRDHDLMIISCEKTDVELFIKKSILNMLYFKKRSEVPSVEEICQYVDEKQKSLTTYDFFLANGLAGLGLGLIQNESQP